VNPATLLDWYRVNRRPLPWRTEVSAWRTLVSELMCQQTRIDTVLPYFARFMAEFPTPEVLAAAPTERVLELWSGLGYYSRARNLQRAAQAVGAAGGFPRTVEGLRALPGVGPYTAGAIASIAFGVDAPVVDGNVERVLSRWFAEASPTRRWTWGRAAELLPAGEAGDWNQALMELGALVCTPRAPRCAACPVAATCRGRAAPTAFPAPRARKAVPVRQAACACVVRDGRVLLVRRPDGGRLAGLWELPGLEGEGHAAEALCGHLLRALSLRAHRPEPAGVVRHTFTHLHLDTAVYVVEAEGEPASADRELRWAALDGLGGMALSTLARKTLALALPGVGALAPASRS
jgi:A/G-specific adenine glycosylase